MARPQAVAKATCGWGNSDWLPLLWCTVAPCVVVAWHLIGHQPFSLEMSVVGRRDLQLPSVVLPAIGADLEDSKAVVLASQASVLPSGQ